MGREQRRKQAIKEGKSLKEIKRVEDNPYNEVYRLLKTICIIAGVFLIIYLVIGLFVTKDIKWFSKDNADEIEEVENIILAKNTFRQEDTEYYVYFYDFKERDSNIETYFINYLYDSKIYRVNINEALNSNFIKEESNLMTNSIEEFKVKEISLIKIESGKVINAYEGKQAILEYFGS